MGNGRIPYNRSPTSSASPGRSTPTYSTAPADCAKATPSLRLGLGLPVSVRVRRKAAPCGHTLRSTHRAAWTPLDTPKQGNCTAPHRSRIRSPIKTEPDGVRRGGRSLRRLLLQPSSRTPVAQRVLAGRGYRLSVATAFYQTWWWATFSPVVFFLLAQQFAEHRADVRAQRAQATDRSRERTPQRAAEPSGETVLPPRQSQRAPLSLSEVSDRVRRNRKPTPTTASITNNELLVGAAVAIAATIAYLYAADGVPVLIGALGALGIGYASGQLRSLHRQGLVANDWLPLLRAATIFFALGFVELYVLIHPWFAGDRLDALLEAFRDGGLSQIGVLGGLSGWVIVAGSAGGAFLVVLAFVNVFCMLFGLSAQADAHADIALRWPRRAFLRWEANRGQAPWSTLGRAAVGVVFALVLSSGLYLEGFRRLTDYDSKPRISQVALASAAGKIQLRFGLDRAATVRVRLRRVGERKPVRILVLISHAGINVARFGRNVSGSPVRRGRYRLRVSATAGESTSTRTFTLTVGS
jgi:hypothetical protein